MDRRTAESTLLPTQLQNPVSAIQCSATARLMAAILEQTAHDIRRFSKTRDPFELRLYRDAYNWVNSPDESHPFAFVPLCEALGYSPSAVRTKLVGDAKPLPTRATATAAARPLRAGSCAAMMVLALLMTPLASRAATVRLPDIVVALDGAGAALTLSVSDAAGLEGADLTIAYDPVSLAVTTQPQATALTADCMLASNHAVPGLVHVSLACPRPLVDGGALLTLTLQPQRTGSSVVDVPRCDLNERLMPCDVKPGSVTVQLETQPASVNPNSAGADR